MSGTLSGTPGGVNIEHCCHTAVMGFKKEVQICKMDRNMLQFRLLGSLAAICSSAGLQLWTGYETMGPWTHTCKRPLAFPI